MVIISYLWGRKIYKVSYDLKKIAIYIMITIILFGLVSKINFNSLSTELAVGNGSIVVFFIVIYLLEIRHKIKEFET